MSDDNSDPNLDAAFDAFLADTSCFPSSSSTDIVNADPKNGRGHYFESLEFLQNFDEFEPTEQLAKCKHCDRRYKCSKGNWHKHLQAAHHIRFPMYRSPVERAAGVQCPRCFEQFTRPASMRRHYNREHIPPPMVSVPGERDFPLPCIGEIGLPHPDDDSFWSVLAEFFPDAKLKNPGDFGAENAAIPLPVWWPAHWVPGELVHLKPAPPFPQFDLVRFAADFQVALEEEEEWVRHGKLVELVNRHVYFLNFPQRYHDRPFLMPKQFPGTDQRLTDFDCVSEEMQERFRCRTDPWMYLSQHQIYGILNFKVPTKKRTTRRKRPIDPPDGTEPAAVYTTSEVHLMKLWTDALQTNVKRNTISVLHFAPNQKPGLQTQTLGSTNIFSSFNEWGGLPFLRFASFPFAGRQCTFDHPEQLSRIGNPVRGVQCIYHFLWHWRNIICAGNDKLFLFFVRVVAHKLVDPSWRPGIMFLITGSSGVGKTLFCEILTRLFGAHGLYCDRARNLFTQFGMALLQNRVLCCADEFTSGNLTAQEAGFLKTMIDGAQMEIEKKNQDRFQATNNILWIFTTEEPAIPDVLSSRRLFATRCDEKILSNAHRNAEFFDELSDAFSQHTSEGQEGLAFLTNFLVRFAFADVHGGDFNRNNIPRSADFLEMQLLGLPPVQRWWFTRMRTATAWVLRLERINNFHKTLHPKLMRQAALQERTLSPWSALAEPGAETAIQWARRKHTRPTGSPDQWTSKLEGLHSDDVKQLYFKRKHGATLHWGASNTSYNQQSQPVRGENFFTLYKEYVEYAVVRDPQYRCSCDTFLKALKQVVTPAGYGLGLPWTEPYRAFDLPDVRQCIRHFCSMKQWDVESFF